MAGYISEDNRKVTTHRLVEMKQRGEKISMLTAYDYTMAQIVDGAGMLDRRAVQQHMDGMRSFSDLCRNTRACRPARMVPAAR